MEFLVPKSVKIPTQIVGSASQILAGLTKVHNLQYRFRNSSLMAIPKDIPLNGINIPTFLLTNPYTESQINLADHETGTSPEMPDLESPQENWD